MEPAGHAVRPPPARRERSERRRPPAPDRTRRRRTVEIAVDSITEWHNRIDWEEGESGWRALQSHLLAGDATPTTPEGQGHTPKTSKRC
jgi:hypothetical protein